MSMPTFPTIKPPIKLEDSLNMIIASIAMEELGLSHIINAEGEKLQYILGTLPESPGVKASVKEVLAVNKSIKSLLDSVMQNQLILKNKLECTLEAIEYNKCPPGPVGPPGPAGCPGPAGPAGPTGARGPAGCPADIRAVSYVSRMDQCITSGKSLIWEKTECSECSDCSSIDLSCGCGSILLKSGRCYTVNVTLELNLVNRNCGVAFGIQTVDSGKRKNWFVIHAPAAIGNDPVSVSAAGIFVSTLGFYDSAELKLILLSPEAVKVRRASIMVMEI